jgi:anti-anti-sigma factor
MTELARIEVGNAGPMCLVRVHGEIDISNAAELRAAIEGALSNGSSGLILDLSPTRYLDSAAIELLFRLAARLAARRLEMRLVVPAASPIRAVLELSGLPRAVRLDERAGEPSASEPAS